MSGEGKTGCLNRNTAGSSVPPPTPAIGGRRGGKYRHERSGVYEDCGDYHFIRFACL